MVTTRRMLLGIPALGGLALFLAYPEPGRADDRPADLPTATFHTSAGDIVLTLRSDRAPYTVGAFIRNCQLGVYDDIAFRRIDRFSVYGGSLLADGSLKRDVYAIDRAPARENDNGLTQERGCVSLCPMSIRTYDRSYAEIDSQDLCVCLARHARWDGRLTVFAEVTKGLGILDRVQASATEDREVTFVVTIEKVTIDAGPGRTVDELRRELQDRKLQVHGRVVDADTNALPNVQVATRCKVGPDGLEPEEPSRTDAQGSFSIKLRPEHFRPSLVLALDPSGGRGGTGFFDPNKKNEPVSITVAPLGRVSGRIKVPSLDNQTVKGRLDVHLSRWGQQVGIWQDVPAQFSLPLPQGRVALVFRFKDCPGELREVWLSPEVLEVDLGTVELKLSGVAQRYGKTPPPWHVTDARGVGTDVKLSDYKGKWVAVEFWGYSCGPCLARGLPELIKVYEKHADKRERFQILAFHDPQAKDFEQLDKRLTSVRKRWWKGKDLPFPILLDSTGRTIKEWGIHGYPTLILIDPEGRVVRGGSAKMLDERLSNPAGGG